MVFLDLTVFLLLSSSGLLLSRFLRCSGAPMGTFFDWLLLFVFQSLFSIYEGNAGDGEGRGGFHDSVVNEWSGKALTEKK